MAEGNTDFYKDIEGLDYGNNINKNDNNSNKVNLYSFPPISSIKDNPNPTSDKNTLRKADLLKDNNPSIYLCKNCNTFPKIKILDEKNISLKCLDTDNEKKSFEIMFKYLTKSIETKEKRKNKLRNNSEEKIRTETKYKIKPKENTQVEKLQDELKCKDHNLKFRCYCDKCKKNKCNKCDLCKNKEGHKIIKFDELNNEINNKEVKYIEDYFNREYKKMPFPNDKKPFPEDQISERVEAKRTEKGNAIMKTCNGKNFIDIRNIKELYEIIKYCKNTFPNYNHFLNIQEIYYYLLDKLKIKYFSYNEQIEDEINIFGKNFVENNKKNCYLIIDGKEVDLCEKFKKPKDKCLEVILVKKNEIENASEMFYNCDFLWSIDIINQWKMEKVTDMSSMFYGCKALKYLCLFSDWNTSKVKDFSNMFYGCECLKEISISKAKSEKEKEIIGKNVIHNFKTESATDLSGMFYGCESLEEISGISKWRTENVKDMSYMFYNCFLIKEINLSNWNFSKVTNLSNMFFGCSSMTSITLNDKDNKKANEVAYLNYMFAECTNLESLKGLSNWNTENVLYINNMFQNCSSLNKFSDISSWKLLKVKDFKEMFDGFSEDENVKKPAWWYDLIKRQEEEN